MDIGSSAYKENVRHLGNQEDKQKLKEELDKWKKEKEEIKKKE